METFGEFIQEGYKNLTFSPKNFDNLSIGELEIGRDINNVNNILTKNFNKEMHFAIEKHDTSVIARGRIDIGKNMSQNILFTFIWKYSEKENIKLKLDYISVQWLGTTYKDSERFSTSIKAIKYLKEIIKKGFFDPQDGQRHQGNSLYLD